MSKIKLPSFRLLLASSFLWMPYCSYAERLNLVCGDKAATMSMNFEVDEKNQIVRYSSISAHAVYIDDGTIDFSLVVGGHDYFHSINRSTGTMTVRGPDGNMIYGYRCELARKKV